MSRHLTDSQIAAYRPRTPHIPRRSILPFVMKKSASTQQMEEPGPGKAIAELNDQRRVAQLTMSNGRTGRPELPDSLGRFIRRRRIDSYLKIWFLPLMNEHSE